MSEDITSPTWTISFRPASHMPTIMQGRRTLIKGHSSPAFWLASSNGGMVSFPTEEAAKEFVGSDRAKQYNPGPRPFIDDVMQDAVENTLNHLPRARVPKAAVTTLMREFNFDSLSEDMIHGIREGVNALTGVQLERGVRLDVPLSTSKGRRAAWAEQHATMAKEPRDRRVGFLFAGTALAGISREYRFMPTGR